MKTYRCKHAVEAMRWTDTDEDREAFSAWFERHDKMFVTRGPIAILPDLPDVPTEGHVKPGEWIVFSDGEFIAMDDDLFTSDYEEVA